MGSEEETPHFNITASVIRQLGDELITDEVTAIMELVKNSYDADADWVKITIDTSVERGDKEEIISEPSISIEDDGDGMNYSDIVSKWMVISLSHKKKMKESGHTTRKGRSPLGDKGLGRLSSQKLGSKLEIISGVQDEEISHHLSYDWDEFKDDVTLTQVPATYLTSPKSKEKKGTRLIIKGLKNHQRWEKEAGDKFRAQLSQLIFPIKKERKFEVYLSINGILLDIDELNEKLRKQAVGQFTFDFDREILRLNGTIKLRKLIGNAPEDFQKYLLPDSGKEFFAFLTNKEKNKKEHLSNVEYSGQQGTFIKFERRFDFVKDVMSKTNIAQLDELGKLKSLRPANPGPFKGEIDDYDLRGGGIDETFKSDQYKHLIKNQIGVRIFRDGFGLKPFGFDGQDWLKLSHGQTSGASYYGLRPSNVIGFISISAKDNAELKEKTDREGFIDSPFSKNFFQLINTIVEEINKSILEKMRRSFVEYKKYKAEQNGGIKTIKDTNDRLKATSRKAKEIEQQAGNIAQQLSQTKASVKKTVDKLKNEPLFVSAEGKEAQPVLQQVLALLDEATVVFEKVNEILNLAKKLEDDADYIGPQVEILENQLSAFSELAGLGLTAEAFTHEIYNLIDRITIQTNQLEKYLKSKKESDSNYYTYVEHVKTFIDSLKKHVNHLAPSLKFNRERQDVIMMSTFLTELEKYYQQSRFGGKEITIESVVSDDFSIRVNRGVLTQVLDNIILNSEYWLIDRKKQEGKFQPKISVQIQNPFVIIWDNGYGIAPHIEDNLFQPFVTTKPKDEGRGLGLFIVQRLLENLDCAVDLLMERNEHNRRYKFQINFQSIILK